MCCICFTYPQRRGPQVPIVREQPNYAQPHLYFTHWAKTWIWIILNQIVTHAIDYHVKVSSVL